MAVFLRSVEEARHTQYAHIVALSLRAFPVVTMETQPTEGKPPVRRDSVHWLCLNSDADLPTHTAVQTARYKAVNTRRRPLRDSPDEVAAVRAVGGLSQVGGHELVSVDLMHPPPDGSLPLPGTHAFTKHALLILTASCCKNTHKCTNRSLTTFTSIIHYITQYCALIDSHIHSLRCNIFHCNKWCF